jgi:hypothetical protein
MVWTPDSVPKKRTVLAEARGKRDIVLPPASRQAEGKKMQVKLPYKLVGERLDYSIDFARNLDVEDTLASCTVDVLAGDVVVTGEAVVPETSKVGFWIEGGTELGVAELLIHVVTAAGREIEQKATVKLESSEATVLPFPGYGC